MFDRNCCDIWDSFNPEENLIKDYQHWKLLIRNRNSTLGNCVAIINRHIESFSDITPEEMTDFANLVKDVEHSLKKSFNYDKINWLMLMMKDKHVHFHIIPRYAEKKDFAGLMWIDEEWPIGMNFKKKDPLAPDVLQQIKNEIIKNIEG